MKTNYLIVILIIMILQSCSEGRVKPPIAEQNPKIFLEHNTERTDNYYWLKNRKDPKVLAYLKAENEYTDQDFNNKTKDFQSKLFKEIKSRIVDQDTSAPYFENGYYYYTRFEKNKEYEIYCRKQHPDSAEQVLLDVNILAKTNEYCDVDNIVISPDNKYLAYAIDTISRRFYDIKIINLETGAYQKEVVNNSDGQMVFANDSRTLFYIQKESETLRSFKLFKHIIGQDANNDKEIFYEDDNTFELAIHRSSSNKYIFLTHTSTTTTEIRYIEARYPYNDFKFVKKREKGIENYIDHVNNSFFLRSNLNHKNFEILKCDSTNFADENSFKTFVKANDNVLIEDFDLFRDYIVISEKRLGLTVFEVVNLNNKESYTIDLGQEAYCAWADENPEPDTLIFRYGYCSPNTPTQIINYNLKSKEKEIIKKVKVPNFDASLYQVKREFVEVSDSTKVPVTLLYKKDLDLSKKNPMLAYAYGAYGLSEEDNFAGSFYSLVDRGFIFAIIHVRGGSEMGYSWYENGKMHNKMNSFGDFIDVCQHYVDNKTSEPEQLYAMGGSAGGLLTSAVANMRGDLFNGIVSMVPFVDVLTTMYDENIPLTSSEYDEWGNPNQKEDYDYMKKYSPYDNIEAKDYPAMMVTTGFYDSQVQYWEPAKYVAKLRAMKTDSNPLYLVCNFKAGHSGDTGRFSRYKENAQIFAFILRLQGINEKK